VTIETEYDLVDDKRVYGTKVVTYSFNGESGKCFADVLALASMQQSYSIENLSLAYSDVVELRQKKVTELGDALATLVEAAASVPVKERKSTDKTRVSDTSKMYKAQEILKKYDITFTLDENGQSTYKEADLRRNDVQTEVDTENNDLQRTMTALEGLLNKRDNSFSTSSKIIDKNNTTAKTTIKSMGM